MRKRCTQRRNLVRRESVCKYATQHIARYSDFMWKECGARSPPPASQKKTLGLFSCSHQCGKIQNFLSGQRKHAHAFICVRPFVCQNVMVDVTRLQLNQQAAARYLRNTPAGERERKTARHQRQIVCCQTSTLLANPSTPDNPSMFFVLPLVFKESQQISHIDDCMWGRRGGKKTNQNHHKGRVSFVSSIQFRNCIPIFEDSVFVNRWCHLNKEPSLSPWPVPPKSPPRVGSLLSDQNATLAGCLVKDAVHGSLAAAKSTSNSQKTTTLEGGRTAFKAEIGSKLSGWSYQSRRFFIYF